MTIAYRVWTTRDGNLVSPFAGITLPENGIVAAPLCTTTELALYGVSYFSTAADALRAVTLLNDPGIAVTTGQVVAPTMPDERLPLYRVAGRAITMPAGRRCATYQITAIYTDNTVHDYGVPAHPLKVFTDAA